MTTDTRARPTAEEIDRMILDLKVILEQRREERRAEALDVTYKPGEWIDMPPVSDGLAGKIPWLTYGLIVGFFVGWWV